MKIMIKSSVAAMKENRLNALLLLFAHKDLSLDFDAVIDDYAKRNPLQWRDLSSLFVGRVNVMGSLRE